MRISRLVRPVSVPMAVGNARSMILRAFRPVRPVRLRMTDALRQPPRLRMVSVVSSLRSVMPCTAKINHHGHCEPLFYLGFELELGKTWCVKVWKLM